MAGKPATILFVDGEEVFAANMAKLLSNRGYRVQIAENGAKAVSALEKEFFDVLVMDLDLPREDGMAVLGRIKRMGALAGAIILMQSASPESVGQARKLGFYDCLSKPCGVDELVERIENIRRKDDYGSKMRREGKF